MKFSRGPLAMMPTLALALAACSGSLFQTKVKPPTVYLLSAGSEAPREAAAGLPVDLAVLKPQVRAGLETDHIAALYPDRRLDYFADARWSGPLDEVMQDLTVRVVQSHANWHNVSGDASAFTSTHWLEITVVDFQAEYARPESAPTIHVHLIGRFGSSIERHVFGRFESDARVVAADNRMSAIVDAYEHAADTALAEITADTLAVYGSSATSSGTSSR